MSNSPAILTHLPDFIHQGMAAWDIPGLALAIVKDDEIIFADGFGVREIGRGDPVDEDTIFAIASNTKAFTAAALGILVQEEQISWDDPVTKHLPGFQMADPWVTRQITVRDLLCHRSGLGTWAGDILAYGSRKSREELIHLIRYIPPAFSFRGGFGYSNLMFLTAGQIITAVTGASWDDFIKDRFLEPLGMTRSSTSTCELPRRKNVAAPHELVGGRLSTLPYRNVDNKGPTGGINSTARDMAQWIRLQLGRGSVGGKQLLTEAVIEETRLPHTPIPVLPSIQKINPFSHLPTYGLGWALMDYRGRLLVQHKGGLDGMISILNLLPEEQLGFVVLTNKCPNSFTLAMSYQLIDRHLGAPARDWSGLYLAYEHELAAQIEASRQQIRDSRPTGTQPSCSLEAYAGEYKNHLYGKVSLELIEKGLVLQLCEHPGISGALEHWHHDTFLCRWSDPVFGQSYLPFMLDGQGKVERFTLKIREDWIDPLEYVFVKEQDQAAG